MTISEKLKRLGDIQKQIEVLENEAAVILGEKVSSTGTASPSVRLTKSGKPDKRGKGTKRQMSPEAKAKIAAAQKARWAKVRAAKK